MTKSEAVQKLIDWLESQVGYEASPDKLNKYAEELDKTNWFNGNCHHR